MARNVVILSPHFPPHYHRFWRQIREAGGNALGIGDAPHEALPADTRTALSEYYPVPDMHDYDALVRACGYYTHRYGRIDRFDSLNEYWLATEARIRDDFNIPGIRADEIGFVRCKSGMKERFAAAGVPVARGGRVRTLAEARALAQEIGYPLVAKPDAGVGALDTYRIDGEADLARVFATAPPVDYLLEQFVTGTIHSFDGLADADGQPVFTASHVFSQGIMETVNDRRHLFYYSQREIRPRWRPPGARAWPPSGCASASSTSSSSSPRRATTWAWRSTCGPPAAGPRTCSTTPATPTSTARGPSSWSPGAPGSSASAPTTAAMPAAAATSPTRTRTTTSWRVTAT
jgi:hypothetical protein